MGLATMTAPELDATQERLIGDLVHAWHRVGGDERQAFTGAAGYPGWTQAAFSHPGLKEPVIIAKLDLDALRDSGMIRIVKPWGAGFGIDQLRLQFAVTGSAERLVAEKDNPPIQGLLVEARDVLVALVRAKRTESMDAQSPILIVEAGNRVLTLAHVGLPGGHLSVAWMYINNLTEQKLVVVHRQRKIGDDLRWPISVTAEGWDIALRQIDNGDPIGGAGTVAQDGSAKAGNVVFIVHGQDVNTRREVKDYFQNRLGFPEPIVLEEKPNEGRTLIEKFEHYADKADIAVVLLTPDDSYVSEGTD